jgi:hypothetical protein
MSPAPESRAAGCRVVGSLVVRSLVVASGVPESGILNRRIPDSCIPDSAATIGAAPKSHLAGSPVPESKVPESKVPESKVPESSVPESRVVRGGVVESSGVRSGVVGARGRAGWCAEQACERGVEIPTEGGGVGVPRRWQSADHDQGARRQLPQSVADEVPQSADHPVPVDRPADRASDDEPDPRRHGSRCIGRRGEVHRERAASRPPPASDGEREVLAAGHTRGSGKHGTA